MKMDLFQKLDALSVGFLALRILVILIGVYLLWSCDKCSSTHLEIPKMENINNAQDQIGQTRNMIYHGVELPNENDVLQQVQDQIYRGVNDTSCPYMICQ